MVTFHTFEGLDVGVVRWVLLPILFKLLSCTFRDGELRFCILLHENSIRIKPGAQSESDHRESWGDSDSVQFE